MEHNIFLELCRLVDDTQLNHIIVTKSFLLTNMYCTLNFCCTSHLYTYISPADLCL